MTPQALLQAGLRNLAKRVNGAPGLKMARNSAINALLMGGHFEASLLLLDDLWDGALREHAPNARRPHDHRPAVHPARPALARVRLSARPSGPRPPPVA